MVLYNSPFAVAALIVGIILAVAGLVVLLRGLSRASQLPEDHTSPDAPRDRAGLSPILRGVLRNETRDTILVVIGLLAFFLLLVYAAIHDTGL